MPIITGALIGGGASLLGGYLNGKSATSAANTQANAQIEAARIAADAAKFTPVGVTSRYGSSNFGYGADGKLNSAGYNLSPDMKAYQDQFQGMLNPAMQQYQQAQGLNQPLMQGAQSMFGLGNQYLSTSPQEQAQKYMADQQALLAPGREQQLAGVRQGLFNTGRSGLAMGATQDMQATNPEMAAYYNSIAQQDKALAADATQGGQQYASFGAGMLGQGSSALGQYYGNQTAASQPWQTTMGLSTGIENLGQSTMDLGAQLGGRQAQAGATQAQSLFTGGTNAANSQYSANAYSPLGSMLQGAGNTLGNYAMSNPGMFGSPNLTYNAGGSGAFTNAGSQQTAMLNSQW
jgi:hypothetical protein